MKEWLRGHAGESLRAVIDKVEIAKDVEEPDVLHRLELTARQLFMSEARLQYSGWPDRLTTECTVIHLCWRRAAHEVEAVGITDYNFGPDVFPFRLNVSEVDDVLIASRVVV